MSTPAVFLICRSTEFGPWPHRRQRSANNLAAAARPETDPALLPIADKTSVASSSSRPCHSAQSLPAHLDQLPPAPSDESTSSTRPATSTPGSAAPPSPSSLCTNPFKNAASAIWHNSFAWYACQGSNVSTSSPS